MKAIGAVALFLLWAVIQAIWSGYVLSVLWGWFVLRLFESAPPLSIASAAGLTLIIRYLTYNHVESDKDKSATERIITTAAQSLAQPLFALVFGWIIQMYL